MWSNTKHRFGRRTYRLQEMFVVVNQKDTCRLIESYGKCKVVTTDFITNVDTLKKVINILKAKHPISFHIPTLTGGGEEYGISLNDSTIMLYENPPKNKRDVEILNVIAKIEGRLIELDVLRNAKRYELSLTSTYLDIIKECAYVYRSSAEYENESASVKNARKKLEKTLVQTQVLVFPKFRKLVSQQLQEDLWSENVDVVFSDTKITFIGATFASNANIEDAYNTLRETLYKLRYKRLAFKWYKYDNETYYTISSLRDKDIQ